MAKVNFNFQDELGNNLNRYLARDVTSGKEYTFDLNRKATITKNGTPLNALNLNQLVNAINDNDDNIHNNTTNISKIDKDLSDIKKDYVTNDILNNSINGISKRIPIFEVLREEDNTTPQQVVIPVSKVYSIIMVEIWGLNEFTTIATLPITRYSSTIIFSGMINDSFSADFVALNYYGSNLRINIWHDGVRDDNLWACGIGRVWGLTSN